MNRKCYIAKYPLNEKGNDLNEIILFSDSYFTQAISQQWDTLVENRKPSEPMLQCWYSDSQQVELMATTNQPFKLD